MRKHYWKYKCTAALLMLWCAAGTLAPAEGGDLIGLSWKPDYDAVRYEVQMKDDDGMFYDNQFVYANSVLLDKKGRLEYPENVSYRVRPIDFDGNPISAFTPYMPFEDGAFKDDRDAPYQKPDRSGEQGGAMLYPVYSFVWMPGAASYEVEVTTQPPENPTGTDPSLFRLWSAKTELSDLYDARPRTGTYYWRVRGIDAKGNPVGEWSEAQKRTTDPDAGWVVGVFGDSISHGGGRMSYSPNDLEYSYEHYLDFPVINLSQSGDTSESMLERFDRDVLPFHVKYLLIMGGSNSLRGGVPAEDVIEDLKAIQQKCIDNGITSILMTLPPINPASIKKTFDEPTVDDWQTPFAKVNAFIRTQPHIDIAAAFPLDPGMTPALALDGLHGDVVAKQRMAAVINEHIRDFVKEPMALPENQTEETKENTNAAKTSLLPD